MKIAIIGAGGLRTPLILSALAAHQEALGVTDLALMDIDGHKLELISKLAFSSGALHPGALTISHTTDPFQALEGADFVITTFRVGGMDSRVVDEEVPLRFGVLGQETTGPGGFAMGCRSIPVILEYVRMMRQVCPEAWLINFANPAGMLTEAVLRHSSWRRVVGICDAPESMLRVIASVMKVQTQDLYLDYFGLNHLGWIRRCIFQTQDVLPSLLGLAAKTGSIPGLPFDLELINNLGMIPNEYLYYYYYRSAAVANILKAGESRGKQIVRMNHALFAELQDKYSRDDFIGMQQAYQVYIGQRGKTYMVSETGRSHDLSAMGLSETEPSLDGGYAGMAIRLMEALSGHQPAVQILNVPNAGAISSMNELDVVEIPTMVSHDSIQPMSVGVIPDHCLGLMKQVKNYEHLTIQAAVEGSYHAALHALTVHPLVQDFQIAQLILNQYITLHKGYFPVLA